jgi:hypothetical protein
MQRTKTSAAHLLHPGWTLALPLLAVTAVLASPPERRLWSVLVVAPVVVLMQSLIPKCRFRTDHYFSPVNLALLLLLVKVFVAPILVMVVGVTNDLFVRIPSRESMEGAVAIDLIAYVALCLGLAFTPAHLGTKWRSSILEALSNTPGPMMAIFFAALGMIGFFLVFGSPGKIVEYFLDPPTVTEVVQDYEGSWSGLLGTVLRPFLAFALVAWWARSVDEPAGDARSWRPMLAGVMAAIGITLANMTFSYNRAAFVFPVVSLVAVYSARVRRISPLVTAAALIFLAPLLFALGNYRAKLLAPPTAPSGAEASLQEAADEIQAYTGGPPLAAMFLEDNKWGAHPLGGSTLVASLLSPVPFLGKSFRDSNGATLYNQALYGMPGFDDQIIPFSAELFVNFHALGVLAGFFLLGQVLGRGHLWFAAVGSSFGAFAIQYALMWCATLAVWSLSVFSQIAIYFLGPIYLYCAVVQMRTWLRGMRTPRLATSFS